MQGAMPTHLQSAPARCEFRGGVESYIRAAIRKVDPRPGRGVVCLCLNYANDRRVYDCVKKEFKKDGWRVGECLRVRGGGGKGVVAGGQQQAPLFCCYTIWRLDVGEEEKAAEVDEEVVDDGQQQYWGNTVLKYLTVRDAEGKWTEEYCELMESVGIPARHTLTST